MRKHSDPDPGYLSREGRSRSKITWLGDRGVSFWSRSDSVTGRSRELPAGGRSRQRCVAKSLHRRLQIQVVKVNRGGNQVDKTLYGIQTHLHTNSHKHLHKHTNTWPPIHTIFWRLSFAHCVATSTQSGICPIHFQAAPF